MENFKIDTLGKPKPPSPKYGEYGFQEISSFIHSYDFEISEYIKPHLKDIITQYKNNISNSSTQGYANIPVFNDEVNETLTNKFLEIAKANYELSPSLDNIGKRAGYYIQNSNQGSNDFHNHLDSTLTFVTYLALPKEGGEIQFTHPPMGNITLKPELNRLYIFPGWMYHRPLPQKDFEWRISVNWGYICKERPIHKFTRSLW